MSYVLPVQKLDIIGGCPPLSPARREDALRRERRAGINRGTQCRALSDSKTATNAAYVKTVRFSLLKPKAPS